MSSRDREFRRILGDAFCFGRRKSVDDGREITVVSAQRPSTREEEDRTSYDAVHAALNRCADLLGVAGAPSLVVAVPNAVEELLSRQKPALKWGLSEPCPTCNGRGKLPSGDDLRKLRGDTTTKEFAALCGWSSSYQGDLERGNQMITAARWEAACDAADTLFEAWMEAKEE